MARIKLEDNLIDVVTKMSEGNPGAMSALMELTLNSTEIDPDNLLKEFGCPMLLDSYEIYGTGIYILYNDQCGRDIRKLVLLLRATQLGIFSTIKLKALAADQTMRFSILDEEWDEMEQLVCGKLKNFNMK